MLLLFFLGACWALTPDEIAQFAPRLPDHIERNTGLKADYILRDNGDGTHTFAGTDVPPHDTWKFPRASGNPHKLLPQNMTFKINQEPILRESPFTCMPHGLVGVSTSGVMIASNFADQKGCPYAREFEELDICDGHPSPFDEYHHHYYSHCIVQPVCGEPSPIVGVAIDGIPIYGPWDENGRQLTQQDLDECGGMVDSAGRYKYIMTKDPPFFMRCLKGELRNDLFLGQRWGDLNFFCSCPYDDSHTMGPEDTKPRSGLNFFWPPPPKPPQVCDFTGSPDEMAVCVDKWNPAVNMTKEWVYETQEIDLAACCPKGADCGFSCKTEEGIKEECYVEKRTVRVIERKDKGYCKEKCTKQCTKQCTRQWCIQPTSECYETCYGQCQTGFGDNHVK